MPIFGRSFSTHIVLHKKCVCKAFSLKANKIFTNVYKKTNNPVTKLDNRRKKHNTTKFRVNKKRNFVIEQINHYSRKLHSEPIYLSTV